MYIKYNRKSKLSLTNIFAKYFSKEHEMKKNFPQLRYMVMVGCKSNCVNKCMIQDIKLEHCSGFNCCMTTIPSGIQVLNASFRSLKEENKASEECKYGFLADDKWLSSEDISYNVQFLEYVPVVLECTASDFITVDPKSPNLLSHQLCSTSCSTNKIWTANFSH